MSNVTQSQLNNELFYRDVLNHTDRVVQNAYNRRATEDHVRSLVPQLIDNYLPIGLARFFPAFLNTHPVLHNAFETHLREVSTRVEDEGKKTIDRLVACNYDFISSSFREALTTKVTNRVNSELAKFEATRQKTIDLEKRLETTVSNVDFVAAVATTSLLCNVATVAYIVSKRLH